MQNKHSTVTNAAMWSTRTRPLPVPDIGSGENIAPVLSHLSGSTLSAVCMPVIVPGNFKWRLRVKVFNGNTQVLYS